ncbi:MAG: hypothetical protein ACK4F7_08400 [Inhella sp.]
MFSSKIGPSSQAPIVSILGIDAFHIRHALHHFEQGIKAED